jgi:glycosyltransferase involved in cell wall biosynthesis
VTADSSVKPCALHVTYSLDFGGVESHFRTLAHTREGRYCHHFCALHRGGAAAEAIKSAGAPVTILSVDPWAHPLTCAGKLGALIRQLRPAVVHTHGAEGNLFGIPSAKLAGVPARIGEEIGIPDHSLKARIAFKLIYHLANRVLAVSEATKNALIALGEVPEEKIACITTPVEIPEVNYMERKPGEPLRIGFVGRLEPIKNAAGLVEALTLLPSGLDFHLLLIGDGSERNFIEQFIDANRLNDKVVLAGYHEAPSALLADRHLYVQPSRTEGLGIALIEAMGRGLPAIATAGGGMAEIIKDGVNGWLIPSGEPQDIADAVECASQLHPRDLARIGCAGRRSVENRFDPANYLRDVEALYDQCLI